ncbi:MAG: hypothetical protein FJ271_24700 [Planctomycetes bacterium]|nr:hypothetical protein [Planctomycetota bacterium]
MASKEATEKNIAHEQSQGVDTVATKLPSSIEQAAENVKQTTAATYLLASLAPVFGLGNQVEVFKLYLDDIMKSAGNPTDPIERMLIEQLVLAHHNIGRLHVAAATARNAEEANVYNAATARLTAEFRRSALALRTYRMPLAEKPRSRPSHNGAGISVNGSRSAEKQGKAARTVCSTELTSNNRLNGYFHERAEPQAPGGRKSEPVEA